MASTTVQALIHAAGLAAGLALAGVLIAGAIIVTEPESATTPPAPPTEPRLIEVWIPKVIQLAAIEEFGFVPPSCMELSSFVDVWLGCRQHFVGEEG